ncbi:invasion associated locus B family protein (plasmid) [Roseomonas sp. CCTCC AB2023176]|uniref:invasion associated locus B family protein n=1 Tax=Roseomonas sp. CCTCC AB2023176 TaxID=3342640 RepID=UPI0035D9D11D
MARLSIFIAALLVVATSAVAQQLVGRFGSWTAATHQEATGKVCYAFTPVVGRTRRNGMLTIVHRPEGRNEMVLRLGRTFRRSAEVNVTAGDANLRFYAIGGNAFARDGRAAVAAFRNGQTVVARIPTANRRGTVSRTFSLSGFSAAYNAISRECPRAAPRRGG